MTDHHSLNWLAAQDIARRLREALSGSEHEASPPLPAMSAIRILATFLSDQAELLLEEAADHLASRRNIESQSEQDDPTKHYPSDKREVDSFTSVLVDLCDRYDSLS